MPADAAKKDILHSNLDAGKDLADSVRTSLGPRGLDKMIIEPKGEVTISNDGATILQKMEPEHPIAKMLVDVSKAQDVEAGDGTTTVCVLAGALLQKAESLLAKNINPTKVSDAFLLAMTQAEAVLESMATPVDVEDREKLSQAAVTSLSSKVVAANSNLLAPMAVDAVKSVYKPGEGVTGEGVVDLNNIKLVKNLGGTIEDTELVPGLVFTQKASKAAGGPTKVQNAKILLVQFQLSPPKTDMENTVVLNDYDKIDRALREERKYLLDLCKKIKATGCNVLLMQKSILRDAVNDVSLHMLAKLGIMVVRDIERSDIEFVAQTLQCQPVANPESLHANKCGTADRVREVNSPDGKIVRVEGVTGKGTVTILCKGATKLIVDEAERSMHDALCVIRSLYKKRFLIAGGGAPEMELCVQLTKYSRTLEGVSAYCVRAFAEAFEVVPYTLAENAGLQPVQITTELRTAHEEGNKNMGVNVKKGIVADMYAEKVIQPLLVTWSALRLAVETTVMILKIDDMVQTRQ